MIQCFPCVNSWSTKCCFEKLIATVLLVAAILKVDALLSNTLILSPAIISTFWGKALLVQSEIALAVWLIVGGLDHQRWAVGSVCFFTFTGFALYEVFRGTESCGCFGEIKVPPVFTAAFDSFTILGFLQTRPRSRVNEPTKFSLQRGFGATLVFLMATIGIWSICSLVTLGGRSTASSRFADGLVVLNPKSWEGEQFPLLEEIAGSDKLREGRWLAIIYQLDCERCLQAIPAYRRFAKENDNDPAKPKVAFIALPRGHSSGEDLVGPSSSYLRLTLPSDRAWFGPTPIVAGLENGRVLFIKEGEEAIQPPALLMFN